MVGPIKNTRSHVLSCLYVWRWKSLRWKAAKWSCFIYRGRYQRTSCLSHPLKIHSTESESELLLLWVSKRSDGTSCQTHEHHVTTFVEAVVILSQMKAPILHLNCVEERILDINLNVCSQQGLKGHTGCGCFREFPEWAAAVAVLLRLCCCGFPSSCRTMRETWGSQVGSIYKSDSVPNSSHTQCRLSHTHLPVCGHFIAAWLSHKCHTNLYSSYLMSKPVRYTSGPAPSHSFT